jgi:Domain of unknown function (DUF397)
MDEPDRIVPTWRKSSHSENGGCVEVACVDGCVLVRDSKDPGGPVLKFNFHEWNAFVGGVNGGEFDLSSLLS